MVRPQIPAKTEGGEATAPARPQFSGVAQDTLYPDMDAMFNVEPDKESERVATPDPPDVQEPDDEFNTSGDDDFEDDTFEFDDRTPAQSAREALRRSRQTQEAVAGINTKIDQLFATMQTNGAAAAPLNIEGMGFSPEDTAAINEAMKVNPAATLEIMQKNMIQQATQYADQSAVTRISQENARRDSERETARLYPEMRNATHPFRRATMKRFEELKASYRSRGIDPNQMPELIQYAAHDTATSNPKLVRGKDDRASLRDDSRRRSAERSTASNRSRPTGNKKDDLPEITAEDVRRGRNMGIDMNDPNVRKSLQVRRRQYQQRRRG